MELPSITIILTSLRTSRYLQIQLFHEHELEMFQKGVLGCKEIILIQLLLVNQSLPLIYNYIYTDPTIGNMKYLQ